ncbi:MAG TPA: FAD-dependent oxidoreductase [Bacteroidetes bacterium]|nr:FAD-dependent oxidoreductase [Bacteroidota bacterium]
MPDFEITVVGAGVVGLAIAARLSEKHSHLVVLEKNEKYGLETSSRNSEVIHAGIYYKPGSLKARLCVEGRDELYALCRQHGISYQQISKIITATNDQELKRLESIYQNGLANGVGLEMLDKNATLRMEPHIETVGAIYSPLTGIINAHELMDYFYHKSTNDGATVQLRCEVVKIERTSGGYEITVRESGIESSFTCEVVINASGLYADRVAAMAGIDIDQVGYRLSFAKGSYFAVVPSKAKLISRLVYPVPRDEGLGVHALIDLGGRLKFGPDVEYLSDANFDYSVAESKRAAFAASIRHILPAIQDEDITPDMSGIRPKLQRKGELPKDFLILNERERGLPGLINLIGIDSPGLTASPAIARYVETLLS